MRKTKHDQIVVKILATVILLAFCGHMGEHLHAILQIANEAGHVAEKSTQPPADFSQVDEFECANHSTSYNHQYKCCNLSHLFSFYATQVLFFSGQISKNTVRSAQKYYYPPGKPSTYSINYSSDIFHPPAI